MVGDWKYRLIFPIYFLGKLVTWQGRQVTREAYLPYRDLSIPESVRHVKFCLYNFDNLKGGDTLFITEGLFDSLKMDYYSPDGIDSTCLFTKTMRDEQMWLIAELASIYKKIIVLLDSDAQVEAISIYSKLSFLRNVSLGTLPLGAKDPGILTKEQVLRLVKS